MLDLLLVLGQVPGTDFQITFYEFIIFWSTLGVWYFRRYLRRFAGRLAAKTATYLRQKAWQRRQLSLPV